MQQKTPISDHNICIHGHFYQPPRENPWINEIEIQESAYPFHDWNERIADECYGPNTRARILDAKGNLEKILNNYTYISFDFGPTLLSWMARRAKNIYESVLLADAESVHANAGHGNAIAQAFNHMIMPLASARDKRTQILWGIRDFRSRFHREPEGMWLPETAVDTETLGIMADNGIHFTVLAQRQAKQYKDKDSGEWVSCDKQPIDFTRPYQVALRSGKPFYVFFYEGAVSQAIAFEGLLNDGLEFRNRLLGAFSDDRSWPQLVHIATDGESYGHHHRFGEMALAFALDLLLTDPTVKLTNYGAFLAETTVTAEAEFHERSAWSCAHGVGRWSMDCGCAAAPRPGWNQQWRAPLREALDLVRDEVDAYYETAVSGLLNDPWETRNDYIELLSTENPKLGPFLKAHEKTKLKKDQRTLVFKLLDMQRDRMFMYTSCGWFFDDVSGIESMQLLRYAACVLQTVEHALPTLTERFLAILEKARSNALAPMTAADLFREKIMPQRTDLRKVVAHVAISAIFQDLAFREAFYGYNIKMVDSIRERGGDKSLAVGLMKILNRMTTEAGTFVFALIHHGGVDVRCSVKHITDKASYQALKSELLQTFHTHSSTELIRKLDHYFPGDYFSIKDLFTDSRRAIIASATEKMYEEQAHMFEDFYRNNKDVAIVIRNYDAPLPDTFLASARLVLNRTLLSELSKLVEGFFPDELEPVLAESAFWNISPDLSAAGRLINKCVYSLVQEYGKNPKGIDKAKEIIRFLDLGENLKMPLDLSEPQILFFEISRRFKKSKSKARPPYFELLAERLRVSLD